MKGFITPQEYAKREGISRQRVTRLLNDGRFPGAIRRPEGRNYCWYIPARAKPTPPSSKKRRELLVGSSFNSSPYGRTVDGASEVVS